MQLNALEPQHVELRAAILERAHRLRQSLANYDGWFALSRTPAAAHAWRATAMICRTQYKQLAASAQQIGLTLPPLQEDQP